MSLLWWVHHFSPISHTFIYFANSLSAQFSECSQFLNNNDLENYFYRKSKFIFFVNQYDCVVLTVVMKFGSQFRQHNVNVESIMTCIIDVSFVMIKQC